MRDGWELWPEFSLRPEPFPAAAESMVLANALTSGLLEDPCSPSPSPSTTAPTTSSRPSNPGPESEV